MDDVKKAYFLDLVRCHTSLFFKQPALSLLDNCDIELLPLYDAVHAKGRKIVIPLNVESSVIPSDIYNVSFNGTKLTLWNRLPGHYFAGWEPLPNADTPLWYMNDTGTLAPAWDLFGTVFDLLTFREERESPKRDKHGRFVAHYSPRSAAEILEVPAFNEAVATIIAAAHSILKEDSSIFSLDDLLEPPVIVLSHDCDILSGSDKYTQGIRAARIMMPLLRGRLPKVTNLWWILRNILTPKRYYFDNIIGIIDLERCLGFTSTLYLLNGTGGRFGARSGSALLPGLIDAVPANWDIGIHYNYDTFLNTGRFTVQLEELRSLVLADILCGRSHYLRFDPERSFPFLERFGLLYDETAGYPDKIGYRCGVGGCFRGFDTIGNKPLDILEIPMNVMDSTLIQQYGRKSLEAFQNLIRHLKQIGGALSVIFHPGKFFNPEFPEMLGVYHRMLLECKNAGMRSLNTKDLAEKFNSCVAH